MPRTQDADTTAKPHVLDFAAYGYPVGHCYDCPPTTVYPLSTLTLVRTGDDKLRHVCPGHATDQDDGRQMPEPAMISTGEMAFRRRQARRALDRAQSLAGVLDSLERDLDRPVPAPDEQEDAIGYAVRIPAPRPARPASPPQVLPPLTETNKATFLERWFGPMTRRFRQ